MTRIRDSNPAPHEIYLLLDPLNCLPRWIPATVDSSAATFMLADMRLPLLAQMPTPATREVVTEEGKPYKNRLRAMGIPVKSNFRFGYHGKGIFSPEYLSV